MQNPDIYAAAFARLCVETPTIRVKSGAKGAQPPSRGCVLKLAPTTIWLIIYKQPPSRGCVLKHFGINLSHFYHRAAAFARLCVETTRTSERSSKSSAAAFARLCVETGQNEGLKPPPICSRLRAAVC